jgi:hypothetical protein
VCARRASRLEPHHATKNITLRTAVNCKDPREKLTIMTSVGEATVAMPSQAMDAIPLVILPAERTNAPEELDPISRDGEDSGEQEHLLAESGSVVRRQSIRPNYYL